MQTFDAIWQVFLHASSPVRLVIGAVVLMAWSRLLQYPDSVGEWLSGRYQVEGLSWRVWRARVRRRAVRVGGHVLCQSDGAYGEVSDLISCPLHDECTQVAVVRFETPGELPRVVPVAQLVPVPRLYDVPAGAGTAGGAR